MRTGATCLCVAALVVAGWAEPAGRVARGLGGLLSGEPTFVDPSADESCVCVPFYQCEDGRVLTDGAGLLDVRFGPRKRCKDFNICCNVPKDKITKIESKPGMEKGVMNSISDGIRDLFDGGSPGSNTSPTSGQCVCVSYFLCDGGTMAPEVASQVDMRQTSSTGRCSHDNEVCCAVPRSPVLPDQPAQKCTCTSRAYCGQADIVPLRPGSTQPQCRLDEVCCTNAQPAPGGSGTSGAPAGVVPDTQRPDYDVWKFCKSYPLSVACAHSRRLNARPTLRESAYFDADADARRLKSAIGYFDATDDELIDVLTKRTFSERALISQAYSNLYGKNLYRDVTRTTRGHFENLMQALLRGSTYYEYLAQELHDGMDRIGTDEDTVLETLISSTNDEIKIIAPLYYAIEQDTLLDDIKGDFRSDLEDILVTLVNGSRDNSFKVSKQRAREQAAALYQDGENRLGTQEETFKYYLTRENYAQLALIFSEYEQLAGQSFTEALEDEFSRHVEDAVLAIVEVTRNLPRYFALRLHDALWGRGPLSKDDSSLIRIVVSRAEIDLATIAEEYRLKYGRALVDDIELKSTGDYEEALVSLCGRSPSK
ncbi:annexin A3-like [Pollicipes pollicipes]|uniref:annexin A3-like n=1 Tax=Pollicipes pollicipes TaxID=41117 RepID=UPI001884C588|nr:annexin A3-like [Pollicipes pollicipes]